MRPRDRWWPWTILVLALLIVAATARAWHLFWGLEDGMPFPDESFIWKRYTGDFVPLRLASFARPDNPEALAYPTFQGYLVGLSTWLATTVGWIPSPWVDQFSGLRVGRIVSFSQSLLVVCLVGLLAARVHSLRAGLFALGLMAVAPLSVMQAHYISTDPLVVFFMTAALWEAWLLQKSGRSGHALAGGALVGLAFGTKYSGLIAGISVAWAVTEIALRERSPARFLRLALWSLAGLAVGVGISCPLCVWRAGQTSEMLAFYGSWTAYENLLFWQCNLAPGLGVLGRPYVYQLAVSLPYACGWAIFLLAAAGLGRAFARRSDFDRLLLVTTAVYLLSAGLSKSLEVRYLLPFVPLLVLSAALLLADLARPRIAAAVFCVAFLYSSLVSLSQVARFSYGDQWSLARWLGEEARSREGDPIIAMPRAYAAYMGLDRPLHLQRLSLDLRAPGEWLRGRPDFLILPDPVASAVLTRRPPDLKEQREELAEIESGRAGYTLASTWRSGFFTDFLYTRLDPALRGIYTQGAVGFRVFAREPPRIGPKSELRPRNLARRADRLEQARLLGERSRQQLRFPSASGP